MSETLNKLRSFIACFSKPIESTSVFYAYYVFFILCLVNILNQSCRWALSSLQSSGLQCSSCGDSQNSFYEHCISQCLDFSDIQFGWLNGPGFSWTMLIASIPLGYIADRYSRVPLLWIGLFIWSLSTVLSSLIQQFWQLALLRSLLGLSQSALNPTAFGLLSDYFPSKRRGLIISIFNSMIYVGEDVSFGSGALSQYTSWRLAFLVLGIPGLILAIPLALTIYEPKRGLSEIQESKSLEQQQQQSNSTETSKLIPPPPPPLLSSKLKFIFTSKPFYALFIATSFRLCGGFSLGAWIQVFYRREFNLTPTEVSLYLAIIVPLGGLSGAWIGGRLSDAWLKISRGGRAWLCVYCSLLAIPFQSSSLLVNNYIISLVLLLGAYFFAEMWFGPAIACIQDLMPADTRSLASAIYFLSMGIGGFAPMLTGILIEAFGISSPFSEPNQVSYDPSYAMLIMVPGMYLLSSIFFVITALLMNKTPAPPITLSSIALQEQKMMK